MALPTQSQQALTWQAYGADAKNLVSPVTCDFTTYSQYTFNPQGLFRQTGTVFASGLVIDNLLSISPVIVTIGPITETVAPYTKTSLQLAGTSAQVTISGTQSKVLVTFFYGTYMGTTAGTNYYAAQLAAGLAVETGFINMFAGNSAGVPVGYLLCDGSAVSRTTYAGLFSVIGTLYGPGDGSTTFNLPDMRGRAPMGAGTGTGLSTRPLAGTGGAEAVTITAQQMPVHTHNVNDQGHAHGVSDPGHNHPFYDPGHVHGVNDPGHAHGVNDPGHVHNYIIFRADNGAQAADIVAMRINNGSAPTYDGQQQGLWSYDGRPNYYQNAEAYNVQIKGATTGLLINSAVSGVAIKSAATGGGVQVGGTGVGVQVGTTGITLSSAGGQSGVTQATPTMPPWTGLNFVIKT